MVNDEHSKTSNGSKDRVLYKTGMKFELCEVIQRSGIMIGGARNLLKRSSIQRTEYKRKIFMMKKKTQSMTKLQQKMSYMSMFGKLLHELSFMNLLNDYILDSLSCFGYDLQGCLVVGI